MVRSQVYARYETLSKELRSRVVAAVEQGN